MSTALKVTLVIAIVVVGALAMMGVAGVFIARNIHVVETGSAGKKTVTVNTPLGRIRVHENDQLNPELVGIPIYPGATRSSDRGGADFQLDSGDLHKEMTIAGAAYITDDSEDKVRGFYEEKFPSWTRRDDHGEFHLEMKGDGRMRTIGIKSESGHTRIWVASVGPPASN